MLYGLNLLSHTLKLKVCNFHLFGAIYALNSIFRRQNKNSESCSLFLFKMVVLLYNWYISGNYLPEKWGMYRKNISLKTFVVVISKEGLAGRAPNPSFSTYTDYRFVICAHHMLCGMTVHVKDLKWHVFVAHASYFCSYCRVPCREEGSPLKPPHKPTSPQARTRDTHCPLAH